MGQLDTCIFSVRWWIVMQIYCIFFWFGLCSTSRIYLNIELILYTASSQSWPKILYQNIYFQYFFSWNLILGQNNMFHRVQQPLKPLISCPTRFLFIFEKNDMFKFFSFSIFAITFFAPSGFLRILDMFFYVSSSIIGVNFINIYFFST